MRLRWVRQQSGASYAYSGEIVIGMVLKMDDGSWRYNAHNAVYMKWTAKGSGEVRSEAYAKRAVARAWNRWLDRAGLRPAAGE